MTSHLASGSDLRRLVGLTGIRVLACCALAVCREVNAAPVAFQATWSGAPNNSASAVATFGIDSSILDQGGNNYSYSGSFPSWITDFQITVSGSTVPLNNRTFSASSYASLTFIHLGVDFSINLGGQAGFAGNDDADDDDDFTRYQPYGGNQVLYSGGFVEPMELTSISPISPFSPVPEPSEWAAISVGVLGLAWLGKRRMTAKASWR